MIRHTCRQLKHSFLQQIYTLKEWSEIEMPSRDNSLWTNCCTPTNLDSGTHLSYNNNVKSYIPVHALQTRHNKLLLRILDICVVIQPTNKQTNKWNNTIKTIRKVILMHILSVLGSCRFLATFVLAVCHNTSSSRKSHWSSGFIIFYLIPFMYIILIGCLFLIMLHFRVSEMHSEC